MELSALLLAGAFFAAPATPAPAPAFPSAAETELLRHLPDDPADPIVQATRTYLTAGEAPVLDRATVVLHPFGHADVPVVRCAPLTVCDIQLEAGEKILEVASGDTVRWSTAEMTSGTTDLPVPHLTVKPTEYEISTNVLITTTRRTYSLVLLSPSREDVQRPGFRLTRRLEFYYPDDMVKRLRTAAAADALASARQAESSVATLASDPTRLHFNYRIKPRRAAGPVRVFDDGVRTYLQLPTNSSRRETPALLGVTSSGEPQVLNYRISPDGSWFIVDGLYPEMQLVLSSGRKADRISIIRSAQ